jgi:hypothetical protein
VLPTWLEIQPLCTGSPDYNGLPILIVTE